jgi:hypothetical protein
LMKYNKYPRRAKIRPDCMHSSIERQKNTARRNRKPQIPAETTRQQTKHWARCCLLKKGLYTRRSSKMQPPHTLHASDRALPPSTRPTLKLFARSIYCDDDAAAAGASRAGLLLRLRAGECDLDTR